MAQLQETAPVIDAQPGIRDRVADFMNQGVQAVSAYAHELTVSAKLTAGVVLSGLAIAACGGGEQDKAETTKQTAQGTPAAVKAPSTCDNIELTNTAFLNYAEGKFIPRLRDVNTNDEAVAYTKSLFSEQGPLAGQSDPGTSSMFNALITSPLFSPDTNNDPSDTRTTFEATLKRLDVMGKPIAVELCKANYAALLGPGAEGFVTYKPNAVMKGTDYILYRPVTDKEGNIVNYKMEQVSPRETEGGIVLDMENVNPLDLPEEDRVGIDRVTLRLNGDILVRGKVPESAKKQKDNDEGKGGKDRTEQKAKSGKDADRQKAQAGAEGDQTGTTNDRTGGGSKQDRGTGSGTQTTGNKGGGTQKGNQGCGDSGKANCGGGSGKNEGNDKGQAGAPGAGAPAPAPAPSGGGGGGGPTGGGGPEEPAPSGGGGGGTPPAEGGGGGGGTPPQEPPKTPPKGADPGAPAGAPAE